MQTRKGTRDPRTWKVIRQVFFQKWSNHGTQLQLGLKKHGKQIYLGPKHAFLKRKKIMFSLQFPFYVPHNLYFLFEKNWIWVRLLKHWNLASFWWHIWNVSFEAFFKPKKGSFHFYPKHKVKIKRRFFLFIIGTFVMPFLFRFKVPFSF